MIAKDQRITLMATLWPDACRAQGWKVSDKPFRLQKLSEILGRKIETANDIESLEEFDLVKKELKLLANKITIRDEAKNRLLWVIENVLMRELRVYVPDNAEAYAKQILAVRFKRERNLNSYKDLSAIKPLDEDGKPKASELNQFMFTLAARISSFRSKAGDSVHAMKMKAGTKCDCTICMPRRPMRFQRPAAAPAPDDDGTAEYITKTNDQNPF